jgi:hypothetical protein
MDDCSWMVWNIGRKRRVCLLRCRIARTEGTFVRWWWWCVSAWREGTTFDASSSHLNLPPKLPTRTGSSISIMFTSNTL